MKWTFRFSSRDAARGVLAGGEGVAVREAAHLLFDAGGRTVLPATVQSAVRTAVEREASRVLAGAGLLEAAGATASRALGSSTARVAAVQTVRAAARQILRSVGVAAGAGAALDGGWALARVAHRVRRGQLTWREAAAHVAREASTGAAATAAGTAAAAVLVGLTGGVAAPAVFLVGAAASAGAKAGLDAWLVTRGVGAIRAARAT